MILHLTIEEEKELLERILIRPRMKRFYPFFSILLYTGLRISEAIGLTWDDIDMDKRTISVNHQLQYAEAGIDIKTIQYLMGHSDIKTTVKVYNHADLERAKRELEKYNTWQETYTNFYTKMV